MIKHIVLWTLKKEVNGIPKQQLAIEMKKWLLVLKAEIKEIKQIEVGLNELDAPDSNYDICLICEFDSMADLYAYQIHPAHLAFMTYVKKVRNERVAIDFSSTRIH